MSSALVIFLWFMSDRWDLEKQVILWFFFLLELLEEAAGVQTFGIPDGFETHSANFVQLFLFLPWFVPTAVTKSSYLMSSL